MSVRKTLPIPSLQTRADARELKTVFKFISPMFGGGVALGGAGREHIKEPDSITPVRGASLRGQLRAWWRRSCAARLNDGTRREREKLLWGWASTEHEPNKGAISIAVDASRLKAEPVGVYEVDNPRRPLAGCTPLAYGAFPLQPAEGAWVRQPGTLTRWKGHFSVTLRMAPIRNAARIANAWPDVDQPDEAMWAEARTTLQAFACFGGLGGRTRRGFGAVAIVDNELRPDPGVLAKQLGWDIARVSCNDADTAHRKALAALKAFRQEPGTARGGDRRNPGRSYWPEPDTIRRATGGTFRKHPPEHPVHDAAPRAVFGMPIIVQFKNGDGDPDKHTIEPMEGGRLASPLILRPVQLQDGGFAAAALRLPLLPGDRAVLQQVAVTRQGRPTPVRCVPGRVTADEARQIRPLRGNRDVLAAFLQQFPALTR